MFICLLYKNYYDNRYENIVNDEVESKSQRIQNMCILLLAAHKEGEIIGYSHDSEYKLTF